MSEPIRPHGSRFRDALVAGAWRNGIEILSVSDKVGDWAPSLGVFDCLCSVLAQCGHSTPLAAQQITTCHEQIGQRTGYQQAMSVLLEPAITHLGEAEHPLDDPDRMFDPRFREGRLVWGFRCQGLLLRQSGP
jgi:hypothetical protein